MNLYTPVLTLVGLLTAAPVLAAEQTVTFSVSGMNCPSCPFIVESAMGSVEGVTQVTANSDTLTAEVVFDDTVASVEDIEFASAAAGYEAQLVTVPSDS
ncbi:cation transporter [uncultured Ruegeria sp.]|uniref:heavy-metal-associated domain-containing protein n=1 Tax=uncultured Ruegeria sp. TaxID=259304 RepID=UPI002624BC2D|nr:cation transporter [uncultured Ruegeria sp.]